MIRLPRYFVVQARAIASLEEVTGILQVQTTYCTEIHQTANRLTRAEMAAGRQSVRNYHQHNESNDLTARVQKVRPVSQIKRFEEHNCHWGR